MVRCSTSWELSLSIAIQASKVKTSAFMHIFRMVLIFFLTGLRSDVSILKEIFKFPETHTLNNAIFLIRSNSRHIIQHTSNAERNLTQIHLTYETKSLWHNKTRLRHMSGSIIVTQQYMAYNTGQIKLYIYCISFQKFLTCQFWLLYSSIEIIVHIKPLKC